MADEQNKKESSIGKFARTYLFAAVPALYLGLGAFVTNIGVERVNDFAVRRNDDSTSISRQVSGVCSMKWIDRGNDGTVDTKYVVCLPGRFMPSHPLYQTITFEDNCLLEDVISRSENGR